MSGRIIIAGTSSGSGKTTLTCGILSALKNSIKDLSGCKCGSDFIDPMFHSKILGVPSENIDIFLSKDYALHMLEKKREFIVIEGVMGYYDGINGTNCSTYDIAAKTGTPVVLVTDCKGMSYSALAQIKGFQDFKKDSNIKAVILNNTKEHTWKALKPYIENMGIKALGYMPPLEKSMPSRHLGLVTPTETENIKQYMKELGNMVGECIDLQTLVEIGTCAKDIHSSYIPPKGNYNVELAVAYDEAFCFYYEANLNMLKDMGCRLIFFSPLRDKKVPNANGLIIGGGYPELYGEALSKNTSMLLSVKENIEKGMPVLAECGGHMYLNKYMEDEKGKAYKVVGVIKGRAEKKQRLVRFGYGVLKGNNCLYLEKDSINMHEFHYWDCTENGSACRASKPWNNVEWDCIYTYKNLFSGFPHLYYPSCPQFVKRFLERCKLCSY